MGSKGKKAPDGGDMMFYSEMKAVGANLALASDAEQSGNTAEFDHALKLADAHLVELEARTQVQIEKQGRKPGE